MGGVIASISARYDTMTAGDLRLFRLKHMYCLNKNSCKTTNFSYSTTKKNRNILNSLFTVLYVFSQKKAPKIVWELPKIFQYNLTPASKESPVQVQH